MLAFHIEQARCTSASVGGYMDHVHLLVGLSRTITVAKLLECIKTATSKWAKETPTGIADFNWQAGYGAFSVSHSNVGSVDLYIRNQAEHHDGMSFQDEFRQLCIRHGLPIDERYAWE